MAVNAQAEGLQARRPHLWNSIVFQIGSFFDSNRMKTGIHVRMDGPSLKRLARLANRSGASMSYLIEAIVLDWLEIHRDRVKSAQEIVGRRGIPKMRGSRTTKT